MIYIPYFLLTFNKNRLLFPWGDESNILGDFQSNILQTMFKSILLNSVDALFLPWDLTQHNDTTHKMVVNYTTNLSKNGILNSEFFDILPCKQEQKKNVVLSSERNTRRIVLLSVIYVAQSEDYQAFAVSENVLINWQKYKLIFNTF